jgi:hypothetical protein
MLAAVTHLADCLPAFCVRPRLASLDPLPPLNYARRGIAMRPIAVIQSRVLGYSNAAIWRDQKAEESLPGLKLRTNADDDSLLVGVGVGLCTRWTEAPAYPVRVQIDRTSGATWYQVLERCGR